MVGFCRKVLMFVLMMMAMARCGSSELHKVGDKNGWNPNVNYTEWSRDQHFYVDDWLLFIFDKHQYNVLEVNKTSYEKCNDQNFIQNITRGGRDVFQLEEARDYYFLSSGGYCWNGMKLALNVQKTRPNNPAPAPAAKDGSSSNTGNLMLSFLVVSIALAWGILFKLY